MGDGSTDLGGRQFVGIDLHRRRSVVVRQDRDGDRLGDPVRINNDAESWGRVIGSFGPAPEVVVEATPTAGTGSLTG